MHSVRLYFDCLLQFFDLRTAQLGGGENLHRPSKG